MNDEHHCLYVRYMQAEIIEILVPRHQLQAIIESLIKVGHSVVKDFFILGLQFYLDKSSADTRQRCNALFARRALKRTLKQENLGKSATKFYEKKDKEV